GLAGGEVANIATPRSVDQRAESVQLFDRVRKSDPIDIPESIVLQPVVDGLKSKRFAQEQAPPFSLCDLIQAGAGLALPSLAARAAVLNRGIDGAIRRGHLLEAGVVDDQVGAK